MGNIINGKIGFVSGVLAPERCGVSDYLRILSGRLVDHGIPVSILTSFDAEPAGVRANVLKIIPDWRFKNMPRLAAEIKRSGVNILHLQFAGGSYRFRRAICLLPLFLRLSGWRGRMAVTLHEYGSWEWKSNLLPDWAWRKLKETGLRNDWWDTEAGLLTTRADRIIVTNDNSGSALRERLPRAASRITRIPLASNIETIPRSREQAREQVRKEFDWPGKSFVFAYFGLIHPVKGLETLLAAFKETVRELPEARLLIIGSFRGLALSDGAMDGYMAKLKEAAEQPGIAGKAVFTGHVSAEKVSLYLSAGQAGILPFTYGVNLKSGSLLAMLAHGLPTVVTRFDPPETTLGKAGVMTVAPKDPSGMAGAMLEIAGDEAKRRKMAEAAAVFGKRFTWDSIVEKHLEIYERIYADR